MAGHGSQIPCEFTGMARKFLHDVEAADAKFLESSKPLVRELRERLCRKPLLRRDHIPDYKAKWKALEDAYCLGSDVIGNHKALRFLQIRLRPLKYRDGGWDDMGREPGIAIAFTEILTLRPDGRAAYLESTVRATVTIHALGRWFERSPNAAKENLISECPPSAPLRQIWHLE